MNGGIIRWAHPSRRRPSSGGRQAWNSAAVAADLRRRPGRWALVRTDVNSAYIHVVKNAKGSKAFAPAGTFEAVSRIVEGSMYLYARYIGEAGEYR